MSWPELRPDRATEGAALARNSASPPSRKVALERFRFADPIKRRPGNVFDHRVRPAQDVTAGSEPVLIILPGLTGKARTHEVVPRRDPICRLGHGTDTVMETRT